mmetsp:Transcript_2703/g.4908  ORF Transcript_2703/g.4908 Transcript_2703/m.4908 type:complete len:159 (+) Transcript_2703:77-553(+)
MSLSNNVKSVWIELRHWKFDIQHIMLVHAIQCMIFGFTAIILPHSFFSIRRFGNSYNAVAHEFMRMYGALLLAIGWLTFRTRNIPDGRLKKIIAETFAIVYPLQAVIMLRAEFTYSRESHSFVHWSTAIVFLTIGSFYGYLRFVRKLKEFELPGMSEA